MYEHEEFFPLVNPRAHRLGGAGGGGGEGESGGMSEKEPGVGDIWNQQLLQHYQRFLGVCSRREGGMDGHDCLAAAYYLVAQVTAALRLAWSCTIVPPLPLKDARHARHSYSSDVSECVKESHRDCFHGLERLSHT